MTIVLVSPADDCRLIAFGPHRMRLTLSDVVPSGPKLTWIWTVPRAARSATWRLLARCGSSQIGAMLTVHGRRHRTALSLAGQIRVLQYSDAYSNPAQPEVNLLAQSWWASSSASILASFHSGSSAGQCTDYVAARRPDIVARVDIWAYTQFLLTQSGGLNVGWAAKDWTANAQRAGIPTGTVPRPGAVIVFQPGAYGAFSDGHVAIVGKVAKDGSFTISAMHAPAVGHVTTRHFTAKAARAMSVNPGVSFIYN